MTPEDTYREEAYERLSELEGALLELEESPDNEELIGQIFRALHTIKGSGAMFGFDEIASFTHEVETVFDMVRNGRIGVTKKLIDLTLKARDCIHAMLEGRAYDEEPLITAFKSFLPGVVEAPKQEVATTKTYRIRFRPSPQLFASGTNPILLINELRELGNADVMAETDAIPPLADMDPEACYTSWNIILSTDKGVNEIRDVFIFVEGLADISIEPVTEKKIGEIFIDRGDIAKEDLEEVLKEKKPLGEILIDRGLVTKGKSRVGPRGAGAPPGDQEPAP